MTRLRIILAALATLTVGAVALWLFIPSAFHWLPGSEGRLESAQQFPQANRPVAPIESTRWSEEDARDRRGEADDVMARAGIEPGMFVADIGAGDGYYTVRLSERLGPDGRVLAQDIQPAVIERLADRVTRENLRNVVIKLGAADDPRLPANSFDRVLMVHMYHEIEEPYAFLWRLWPALRGDGEVIIVDGNRPIAQHGTPLPLLICEFEAVGYRAIDIVDKPSAGGYFARFVRAARRPAPEEIRVCDGG